MENNTDRASTTLNFDTIPDFGKDRLGAAQWLRDNMVGQDEDAWWRLVAHGIGYLEDFAYLIVAAYEQYERKERLNFVDFSRAQSEQRVRIEEQGQERRGMNDSSTRVVGGYAARGVTVTPVAHDEQRESSDELAARARKALRTTGQKNPRQHRGTKRNHR